MRTDGHQNGVILPQQLRGLCYAGIALDLDADLIEVGCLLCDHLARKAVGGDAVSHLAAQRGIGLFDGDAVALLGQVKGRGHARGAAADHADLPAGGAQAFLILLPEFVVRMLGSIALDVADGDRLIHLSAAALPLAGVGADAAQALREGDALVDDGGGFVVTAFLDEPHIARHIGVRRALRRAGDQRVPLFDRVPVEGVADGAGGADLGAGAAEAAVGVLEELVVQRADIGLQLLLVILQHAHLPEILAGAHTAPAEDAAVHVVDEKGVALVHLEALDAAGHARGGHAHVLNEGLQLALAVFGAGGAVLGMRRQQQLHGEIAQLVDPLGFRADDHALRRLELARGLHALLPLHLHNAEAAGAQLRQIGMVAEMGDVNAVLQCGLEDVHALLNAKRAAVDRDGNIHKRFTPVWFVFSSARAALRPAPQALRIQGRRAGSARSRCAGRSSGSARRGRPERSR